MTTLSLTVLCHPEYGSAGQRRAQGGGLTVGRGAECDWALPDPMKSLSRTHCRLSFSAGAWQVQDLSTNGTFINGAVEPVGRDRTRPLHDGDRLRLGDYEIEVRIQEEASPLGAVPARPALPSNPFADARLPGLDDPVDVNLRSDFDHSVGRGGAFADHGAASSDAFVPPPVVPQGHRNALQGQPIVPDDWLSDLAGPAPQPGPAASKPIPSHFDPLSDVPPAPPSQLVTASPAAPAAPLPPPLQGAAVVPAAPPAVPLAALAPSGPVSAGAGDLQSALATLLAGAGLPPGVAARAAEDPEAALKNAGALLQAAVAGVRALLIARGMVKREFRIEQTMLHSKENNPLKFAASDEQALAALLDPRAAALRAMQESINDLTSHQVAVLAATQTAARALLDRLEPGSLEAEDTGSRLLPNALEKRLWEAYKRRHAKLLEQFEDDFESAFGKAFARAYEQAVEKGRGS